MKALQVKRSIGRLGLARVASALAPAAAVRVGPLDFTEVDDPDVPGPGWHRVHTALAGICGSDLSMIEGHASTYFDDWVSFPFVPGHEVVGRLDDGSRVVLEPVLGHAARGFEPPFEGAAPGDGDDYAHLATGRLEPGIQIGFCCSTGGGWAPWFWAHESQLHGVDDDVPDERAVLIEPLAGGIHAALLAAASPAVTNAGEPVVAVLGAGTMGLAAIAGLVRYVPQARVVVGARYPHQQRLARELGAHDVVPAAELPRAVRRIVGCHVVGDHLSSGAHATIDAVGNETSLAAVLRITRPRGRVVMMGMPGEVTVDLTGLWHRETELVGAYTYGTETLDGRRVRTFDLATETATAIEAERWLSATYRLADHVDAIAHAAEAGRRGATKIAFDFEEQLMPRPGFVLDVDRSTPPTLVWNGEGLSLEKLPADRSRVIYPPEPLAPIDDIDGAIREALLNPLDQDPLPTLLFPGMQLTIAFDDISLPLPPMRRPDVRQRVIEAVLDMAAEAGVDDVHLICALALHRRMTEAELRHAIGDRVYDAFEPRGMLTQHDAEDPDNLIFLGTTPHGEEVEINKRAATSDLLVYVNINLVAMDGGWKSTATGLASYRSLRHHHNPTTMEASHSFMDQHRSELHKSNWRMGKVLLDSGVKVFQIETTLNTDTFPAPFDFLSKREWEWSPKDRATYLGTAKSLSLAPTRLARKILHSIESPHQMTSVQAGEVEAVHRQTTENVYRQHLVEVEGQTDILTMGIPYICPYNVNSIMNPILVMCMGLGYLFNLYRGKPLVREGGVVIMFHPTQPDFHPVHHPSYIDFYEQVLAETTDPHVMSKQFEERYANDDWYRHLYRTGNAYHGVHPFYMWYWGAHAMRHCGRIIIVGGDPKAVRRLGFVPASTLDDALEIASDVVGRSPTITHIHNPPILMADVR